MVKPLLFECSVQVSVTLNSWSSLVNLLSVGIQACITWLISGSMICITEQSSMMNEQITMKMEMVMDVVIPRNNYERVARPLGNASWQVRLQVWGAWIWNNLNCSPCSWFSLIWSWSEQNEFFSHDTFLKNCKITILANSSKLLRWSKWKAKI